MLMSQRSRRVIIFDWDDTICPSSFVDQWKIENFKDLPLHFQNLFCEVGKCAEKCLDAAAMYGEVIIITNSDDGWVKFSAERFVPNLLPCLDRYRIVSARTRYERFYPGQPLCWKAAAFAHEVNEIYTALPSLSVHEKKNRDAMVSTGDDEYEIASLVSTEGWGSAVSSSISSLTDDFTSILTSKRTKMQTKKFEKRISKNTGKYSNEKEVISFGDSMEERTAVRIVADQLNATPKSVMFINSPSPIQLIGQLNMLTSNMEFVCCQNGYLDVEISPRQAIKVAEEFLYSKDKTNLSFNSANPAAYDINKQHDFNEEMRMRKPQDCGIAP